MHYTSLRNHVQSLLNNSSSNANHVQGTTVARTRQRVTAEKVTAFNNNIKIFDLVFFNSEEEKFISVRVEKMKSRTKFITLIACDYVICYSSIM